MSIQKLTLLTSISQIKHQNVSWMIILIAFGQTPTGSLFRSYTETTPLENGGHTVWMDYRLKIPKFARKHWCNGFYEVAFPLLYINYPLGKRGPHSLNGLQAKNPAFCAEPLRQGVLFGPFSIIAHFHTNTPHIPRC